MGDLDFWDLIFKRYSSPFLFLDNLIENDLLCNGIDNLFNQKNEDKLWELYLSLISIMAMNGEYKSFEDWKNEVSGHKEEHFEAANMEEVKEHSINILKNFKP